MKFDVDLPLGVVADLVGRKLKEKQLTLVTAESCTGGGVAHVLTMIAGCSAWFDRGFVTYSNEAKQEVLGVDADMLAQHGAVSLPVVGAMASGALLHSRATCAVAVSGIAGPGGATKDKPVGTVCFAWRLEQAGNIRAEEQQVYFGGNREAVRQQAISCALQGVLDLLDGGHA